MTRVPDALEQVSQWAVEEGERQDRELAHVRRQLQQAEEVLAAMTSRRAELRDARAQLDAQQAVWPARRLERAHRVLFATLGAQAAVMAERERAVIDAAAAPAGQLEARLRASSVAPLVDEYLQFVADVRPGLGPMPESYRSVVVEHHQRLSARLAEHVELWAAEPVAVDGVGVAVDVVLAVDAPDGQEELLMVILPVADRVALGWHDGQDGLQTWLAARVVQAIHEAAKIVAFPGVHAVCGGHRGLMAIEVELYDAPADFVATFADRLSSLLSESEELTAAGVVARAHRIHVDVLMPPDPSTPDPDPDEPFSQTGLGSAEVVRVG